MLDPYKIKLIHILLKETKLVDVTDKLVIDFSSGRTTHVSDMSNSEANLLTHYLNKIKEEKITRMRKKVIHLLCVFGMTTSYGTPDIDRIQVFIKGIGSRNPKKKGLYHLSTSEIRSVLNQVEQMVNKTLAK